LKTDTSVKGLASLRTKHVAALSELDKYQLIVENIEDYAIFMMDPDGYIQTWNKGAQKNKGYTPAEIIGEHFSKFYLPEDRKARKPELALELARKYGRVENEDWRVKKDGSKFWANVVVTALYDANGELVGFAKITRNLTERKQHEDDLRRANTTLLQQQRELEALNASKDEFVSLASHQLRTPATVLKQLLALLADGYLGPLQPNQLDIIHKAYESNERQLAIVTGLLKVAQLDAGKVILKKVETDMVEFVRSITDEYADLFNERGQRYFFAYDGSCNNQAVIDYENFRMALENIIDNASKYTPAGGEVKVTLSCSKDILHIVVQDTGVGIAPEYMSRLFERFSRIPNELPHSVQGSGLGLYWANKIITLHSGNIDVRSQPGQGTTFQINLPKEGSHAYA
jgi:PAS domain S-box-containing protein